MMCLWIKYRLDQQDERHRRSISHTLNLNVLIQDGKQSQEKENYSPPFGSSSSSLSCSVRYSSSPSKISKRLRMESLSPLTMFSPTERGRDCTSGNDKETKHAQTHTQQPIVAWPDKKNNNNTGSETGSLQKQQCSLSNKRLYWVHTQ